MNEHDELQEFDLDDILNEFHEEPEEAPEEQPAEETLPEEQSAAEAFPMDQFPDEIFLEKDLPEEPLTVPQTPVTGDTLVHQIPVKAPRQEVPTEPDTLRMEKLSDVSPAPRAEEPQPAPKPRPKVIEIDPKLRRRELKKALIAGPEKRYYELDQEGIGRLQTGIFVNILIVLLCAAVTAMQVLDLIPENRLRLVIFSQVLAMLLSAWLGSRQLLDGLWDMLRLRFSVGSMLTLTFAACCADAVFCLKELRIPCCAAFSLEMTMAMLRAFHRHTTEMSQMDTLRKAVRLHGLVKKPDFFGGRPGILRASGKVADFMESYQKTSGPELVQGILCFVTLLLCGGISAFTGMRHDDVSLAVQILSTSLLVAVPAGYFVAFSRPTAILQKRLHMVGTVLCGWKGVKGLKGKVAVPLRDEDLFPLGATKLNGVKFYGDRTPTEVISYAASLVIATDSGLTPLFRQLLTSRGGREMNVRELKYYPGGVGGTIGGESTLIGSADFLRELGVEVPQNAMVEQAVYVALDGEFSAVVAVSYGKMRSASGGLVSLCGNRKVTPVMVGSDFMVTETLIRSKFGVNTKRFAFPGQDVRALLRETDPEEDAPACAMTTREELISFSYAISGARSLRTACTLGLILHIAAGIIGLLIMLVLGYLGSVTLLTPTNVLLYQLVWLIPGLLLTEWTRTV